jgi:hypothetical protein
LTSHRLTGRRRRDGVPDLLPVGDGPRVAAARTRERLRAEREGVPGAPGNLLQRVVVPPAPRTAP